jgi:hypothetical protein
MRFHAEWFGGKVLSKRIYQTGQHITEDLYATYIFNPLNAELNPMCHLLILLRDLTFMGKCIVSISNKMLHQTVDLYLETTLHVSGGTATHHQERIQLYLHHLVFVAPLLLSTTHSTFKPVPTLPR